jgi:outer membrane protein OmpA-like peptidoglycan-associated protein
VIPIPREVTYSLNGSSLTTKSKDELIALAKKLDRGAKVVVTGYAHDDPSLAKIRAQTVIKFLENWNSVVHYSVKIVTTSTVNKAIVVTTRQ